MYLRIKKRDEDRVRDIYKEVNTVRIQEGKKALTESEICHELIKIGLKAMYVKDGEMLYLERAKEKTPVLTKKVINHVRDLEQKILDEHE